MSRKPTPPDPCPNLADHTAAPSGYLQWHEWAAEMTKTHRAIRCAGCGLYAMWVPAMPPVAPPTSEREAQQ